MSRSIHGDSLPSAERRFIRTVLLTMRVRSLTGPCKRIVQSFALVMTILLCLSGCERQTGIPRPQSRIEGDPASKPQADRLRVAQLALRRGDKDAAEQIVQDYLVQSPNDVRALELLGDIAENRGQTKVAAELYQTAANLSNPPSEALLDKLGMQLIATGRAFDTLKVLEQWIGYYPNSVQPRVDFVGMASILGLAGQAVPSLRWLTQRGQGDPEVLQVLANPLRVEPDPEFCQSLLEQCPDDLRPHYGLARLDAQNLRWGDVKRRLQPVLGKHPEFLPAYTLYGQALTELGEFDQLTLWQSQAPPSAESSSEYWLVAGKWAQHRGKQRQAARAFWEATRVDPTGASQVWQRWLRSLREIGQTESAEKVAKQLNTDAAIQDALLTHLERSARSQQAAMRVAEAMKHAGRRWEAEAWARLALSLPEQRLPDPRKSYLQIRSGLTVESPWQDPTTILARQIDLSHQPPIDWITEENISIVSQKTTMGKISFRDEAKERGWIQTCEVAPEAAVEGHWIYQSVGGGVGVLDFDLDGWPDLTAAMLDGKPLQSNSSPNKLFRNLQGQFREHTSHSGYVDRGFTQGITIGDFNEDGFPDIFDANIGRNRLYRNNGDGTFTEVASQVGLDGQTWTTSAVLADINGDGVSDLFEVSYCGGEEPYKVECRNKRGLGSCTPLKFEAEKDRVWRGRGNGTFEEVTDQWMDQSNPGRALGIVAGRFDERPGIDLYVANDMTGNHFWSSGQTDSSFGLLQLAAVRGLGSSGRSRSQASMGMAAGDPDGDGDIDFFLTHFTDDHNTYYEQVSPGLWVDRSYQVGLAAPSLKFLGFGTEWVDFDNNGTLELIVVNGHVDDVDQSDVAYRMPPQLFRRTGNGEWEELERGQLGPYFTNEHLGRALASVDADRDGRVDVAITHLYQPVSLLINDTDDCGQSISLQLKATRTSRDGIGATVQASVAGRKVTAQLLAGDGYMCSNERRITIGCGNNKMIDGLTVTWASGQTESFGTLDVGHEYLLVQGSGEVYRLPKEP